MFKGIISLSLATFGYRSSRCSSASDDTTRNAICILHPDGEGNVHGVVSFSQENLITPTKIVANIRGLIPNSLHGFHIHQFGDLTEGCKTAGPHFNPFHQSHGSPTDEVRHVGDLGNLKTDSAGNAFIAMTDPLITLFGDHSIIGRSVVVHRDSDDLGKGGFEDSLTTGHAGARVACGVIGLCDKFKNLPPAAHE